MPLLQQAYEAESAKADGVVILTVNVQDTSNEAKTFLTENSYTMPALVDASGRVGRAYSVSAIPITFFIDREGVIKYVKRGMFLSINELNVDLAKVR